MKIFKNSEQRLRYFLDTKGITPNKLSKEIGVSNSYFSRMAATNGSIGSDILIKILKFFPDLNSNWVLTGTGPMLRENLDSEDTYNYISEPKSNYCKTSNNCEYCKQHLTIINSQQKTIETQDRLIAYLERIIDNKCNK